MSSTKERAANEDEFLFVFGKAQPWGENNLFVQILFTMENKRKKGTYDTGESRIEGY